MEQRKFLILVVLGLFKNISFLVVVVECLSENEFNLAASQLSPPPIQDFSPPVLLTPPPPPPATPFVPPPQPPPQAPQHPPPPQSKPRFNHNNRNPATRGNERRKFNFGEKIGLTFVCVGGLLQIGVIWFLGFKRWQISKIRDR